MTVHLILPEFAPRAARRWAPHRKAELCRLVLSGEETFASVAGRHQLSDAELGGWIERYRRHGVAGLSVTRFQQVRT